ncbi:DUF935 family protein [Flavobacteriaceae bacterium Ap0902]|nr:DUF935 family protein [Flavobacteriaceae bacterium Ap0902]
MMKNKTQKKAITNYSREIVPKAMSRVRADVMTWKQSLAIAESVESPKMYPYYNLLKDMMLDAHTYSQLQNRKRKTLSSNFLIKNKNGEVNDELTSTLQKSKVFNDIIGSILEAEFYGHSLIELSYDDSDKLITTLIPRQNVIPQKGQLVYDYNQDKSVDYRNANEYGIWLLEFMGSEPLGLLNKAIPHILFSRFAQSCWSELCEIYGIPPRVMHTNTQDPMALKRAEKMMMDMGAAAWFIIDDTEKFEFATTGMPASGDVYDGLIKLCRDNISLLISGAIIGQDTKFGSKGKEQSSQDVLQDLVDADQTMVEQYMNGKVLPALAMIGFMDADLSFEFEQADDLDELWQRTRDILPFKNIDNQWLIDKFGIQVTGERAASTGNNLSAFNQNLSADFFD